jgi:hypothetical protein
MIFMGNQNLPHGTILKGYHCMDENCRLFESWQSFTVEGDTPHLAMNSESRGIS